jgi:hypothetical protein
MRLDSDFPCIDIVNTSLVNPNKENPEKLGRDSPSPLSMHRLAKCNLIQQESPQPSVQECTGLIGLLNHVNCDYAISAPLYHTGGIIAP